MGESSSRYGTPPTTSPAKRKRTDLPEWQVAIEVLMLVRSGPTMMDADRGHESAEPSFQAVFNPERKDTHVNGNSISGCPLPDNSAPLPASPRIGYGARSCRLVERAESEEATLSHDR